MSTTPLTVADGRRLAHKMLVEIEDANERMHESMSFDAFEDGANGERMVWRRKPQCNLVAHYIANCGGNAEVLKGFGQVLTDYLMCVEIGCPPYLSKYSRAPAEHPRGST